MVAVAEKKKRRKKFFKSGTVIVFPNASQPNICSTLLQRPPRAALYFLRRWTSALRGREPDNSRDSMHNFHMQDEQLEATRYSNALRSVVPIYIVPVSLLHSFENYHTEVEFRSNL
jgi:hypothetical protein